MTTQPDRPASNRPEGRRAKVPLGPRGLAVLTVVGLAGIGLAVHGWSSSRGASAALGGVGVSHHPPSTQTGTPPPSQHSASPSTAPSTGPASSKGPLLSSEPYASYAFSVWPGTPSQSAKAAAAGLGISVRRVTGGISVRVTVNGQSNGPAHTYPAGSKVYVVEASLGDDSGNSDYNLGDDGLVVTDSAGRIVQ